MADRYYVCPVIGTGTDNNPWRAAAGDADNVTRASAVIPSAPDGSPLRKWTVCRINATDFTDVEAMRGVFRLGTRAQLSSTLTDEQKTTLRTNLREIDEDVELTDVRARDLILRLIRRHHDHVDDVLVAFP